MTKPITEESPPALTREQRRLVREIAALTVDVGARAIPVDELLPALDVHALSTVPSPANDDGDAS